MYSIDVGALTPALAVTITDAAPIDATGGVTLQVLDESGNLKLTDPAPTVAPVVGNPNALVVTHNWVQGQTDLAGIYQVRVITKNAGGVPSTYPGDSPLTFYIGLAPLAGYCTIQQARDQGATGTDAEVLADIAEARLRIDRYTGDTFAPTRMVVVSRVRNDGTALMPRIVRSVEYVQPVGGTPLASSAWRALSSRTPGQVDAVVVGGMGYGDPLIVGAEPWRGGWQNLLGNLATGQVQVGGIFGWDAPPPEVIAACAVLAAQISTGALPGVGGTGLDTDDEGNVVTITQTATASPTASRTTGNAEADAQLAPLVARRIWLAG